MNRILLSLIIVVCFLSCKAQEARYRCDFSLSKRNFADTIAIEYDGGQVLVPVTIGGRQHRFLLDTGASQTVIFNDTPFEGMRTVGRIVAHDAVGRRDSVPMVVLPPMELGHLVLSGCQATVQRRAVTGRKYSGILGFDLVCRGLEMKIDVPRRRLILSDRKHFFASEPGIEIKYKLNLHVPYITVVPYGRYREEVLFDTGSRQLYAMNKGHFDASLSRWSREAESQVEGRATGRHAMGHSGTEPRGEVVFLGLDSLMIGNYALRRLHIVTTQGGSHVGAPLLESCAVVFSPAKKRMRLQPANGQNGRTVDNPQLDKAVVNDRERATIGLVWPGGRAYEAGFREGDVLLQADDVAINSFADYVHFRYLIGHQYLFTVQGSDGQVRQVKSLW